MCIRDSNESFRTLDGAMVSVPTMVHGAEGTSYLVENDNANPVEAVSIPYAGGELSMVVVMPQDLVSFESGLTLARLDEILGGLRSQAVDLHLPKWKLTDS